MSVIPVNRRLRLPAVSSTVALGSAVLAVVALVVGLVADPSTAVSGHAVEDTLTAIVWAALGGLLAHRVPGHRFGPLFLIVSVAATTAVAASAVALDPGRTGAAAAAWLAGWVWVAATFVPVTILPAWFPDGPTVTGRWIVRVAAVGMTVMAAGIATEERIELTPDADVANRLSAPMSDALFLGGSVAVLVCAVLAVGALVLRLAHASGERRRQIAPVVVAIVATIPALAVAGLLPEWGAVVQLAVTPLVPAATALAVLRYRLYDVEFVLRRSLVFVGLTALVLGGYVLLVQAAANLVHRTAGLPESIVAVSGVALVFQPARAGLQRVVGRWVYGERDAPAPAIADLGHLLSVSSEPQEALRLGAERLRAALRVPWVEVRSNGEVLSTTGTRPAWMDDDLVTDVPLVHLGTPCGAIRVAARGPRDRLSARDRLLVDQLAGPIAAVVAARRYVLDLQRSREAVVVAREEERRRVRRDLHDGVGPLLSAIATHADVVSLRAGRDPGSTAELLDRIRRLSIDAVSGLRRVIDDLQPVGLDELGLGGALTELGAVLADQSDVRVDVDAEPHPALPAAVELAVYRVGAEAINNAVRHSGGRVVQVRLRVDDQVRLVVTDDGTGISEAATDGVGMGSMRERAVELGGTLQVTTGPGGTRIVAEVPRHDDGVVT